MNNYSEDVSCEHGVLDDDSRFVIDADTREITYTGETEIRLVQKDHNSERCTFEMPKTIDGHDMSKCNVIRIHFVNISAEDPAVTNPGLFEVDMTSFGPLKDNPSKLTFSWLICDDATQLVGTLSFIVELMCRNDNTNEVSYSWHTGVYTGGVIERGIDNSNLILSSDKYYDTLNTWIKQIETVGANVEAQTVERIKSEVENYADIAKRDITEHAVDIFINDGVANGFIVDELGTSNKKVISQSGVTTEFKKVTDTFNASQAQSSEYFTGLLSEIRESQADIRGTLADIVERVMNTHIYKTPEQPQRLDLGKTYIVQGSFTAQALFQAKFVLLTKDTGGSYGPLEVDYVNTPDLDLSYFDIKGGSEWNIIRFPSMTPFVRFVSGGGTDDDFTLVIDVGVDFTIEINGFAKTYEYSTRKTYTELEEDEVNSYLPIAFEHDFNIRHIVLSGLTVDDDGAYLVHEVDLTNPLLTDNLNYTIEANGISSITKTGTALVDGVITHTYTILFDDGKTTTFDVKDGTGIASVSKTKEDKHEDTYVMELTNGTKTEFKVPSSTAYNVLLGRISALEKLHGIDNSEDGGKLSTPANVRFILNGLALWDAVQNAIGYKYRIYSAGGSYEEYKLNAFATTLTNQSLTEGQSIMVMAVGDGINYFNSDWSESITYVSDSGEEPDVPDEPDEPTISKLAKPVITISETGLATWAPVPNAVKYKYTVYSTVSTGSIETTDIPTIRLSDGEVIQVLALGDGVSYSDSDYAIKKYDAPEDPVYVYYGVGTVTGESDDPFTSEFITGLTSVAKASRVCSFTVSPTAQYIYFAAPKSYCVDSSGNDVTRFVVGGLDQTGTFNSPQTVTIGDIEYYVYRSMYTLNWNGLAINVS